LVLCRGEEKVETMWASVIAVLGTLAGGVLMTWATARTAKTARRETRRDTHRREALGAVTALATAVANHRRAMVLLEEAKLSGTDTAEAREEKNQTRSAITAPLFQVSVLAPALTAAAEEAVQATYAIRNAPDEAKLQALHNEAKAAADRLAASARGMFAVPAGRDGTVAALVG
jgi:hypothetical protein